MFRTADEKFIVLAVGTDVQFNSLAKLINLDTLGLETNQQRLENRSKLNSELEHRFRMHPAKHWNQQLNSHGIPFGQIKNMKEVFDDEKSKPMILKEIIDGIETKRVRTALI